MSDKYLNTKLELIPLPNGEDARAWVWFTNSPMKHVLHNEIVKKVLTLRDKLEKEEDPKELSKLQSAIASHREFLGLIHRNDPLPTK